MSHQYNRVGRTPWSAADPLVGLFVAPASRTRASGADQGVRPTVRRPTASFRRKEAASRRERSYYRSMKIITLAFAPVFAATLLAQAGFDYNSVQRDILIGINGNPSALKR